MERTPAEAPGHAGERNHGVDILRVVSMIMVPILHVLWYGTKIGAETQFTARYAAASGLEILCLCAVNCYALISGYVGYGRKHKLSSVLYLYLQVVFYSLAASVAFRIYDPGAVGLTTVLKSFLPIYSKSYWYYRAYVCLFFVMPALDLVIEKTGRKAMRRTLFALFLLFTVIPTFVNSNFGGAGNGLCFLWIALLYLAGAYIKKYGVKPSFPSGINLIFYFACALVTFLLKFGLKYLPLRLLGRQFGVFQSAAERITKYNSPTILLCALFLLFFFANLRVGKKTAKIVSFFAPLTFGVYLLHEQPLVREYLIVGRFTSLLSLHPALMILAVIGIGVGIWLLGSLADRIRLLLFDVLRIRKLCDLVCRKLSDLYSRIAEKTDRKGRPEDG